MGRLSNEEKQKRIAAGTYVEKPNNAPRVPTQIKQMSGFADEKSMVESLPTNTMATEADRPKPRKKRAPQVIEEFDPLMSDPIYKAAVEEMRSAGLSTAVKGAFEGAALATKDESWELERDEVKKVDGFSYVLSKKYAVLDPTRHWLGMAFYFCGLMGTFIFKRAAKAGLESWIKKFTTAWFGDDETEKTAQELEEEKAQSV